MPNHFLLIDGYGFVFRAYHSLPPLTRPDGTPVGAVYGFVNMLLKVLQEMPIQHIAVVLDAGRKTFRHDIYPDYKANRPPAPEDLIPQFPLVREAAHAMGLPVLELEGYEADDIIATCSRIAHEQGEHVTIISSDKDLMQLINDTTSMFDPMKMKPIGAPEVMEKFGVTPEKVLDVLSLMGDSSDNVPGVPGIGPKTAAELINTYGSLETLLASTTEIKQAKRRENLEHYADQARLSQRLIRLEEHVPLPSPLEALAWHGPDVPKLVAFLQQQQFRSLISRVEKLYGTAAPAAAQLSLFTEATPTRTTTTVHTITPNDHNALQELKQKAFATGMLALLPEQDKHGVIMGIYCAATPEAVMHFPLQEAVPAGELLLNAATAKGWLIPAFIQAMHDILNAPGILKIGHDVKTLLQLFPFSPLDDVMSMSYVLGAGRYGHGLNDMIARHALDAVPEVVALLTLHHQLKQELFDNRLLTVYERIERPLIPVLSAMEQAGITIDPGILRTLSRELDGKLYQIEQRIHQLAGTEFNIGSPKQLGEVLFDRLGLPGGKRSKTGSYSTGADILEELSLQGFDIADCVLEWRQYAKLKNTYTDTLPEQISPEDGRVHTHFATAVASTGRLSSTDPNLQNIPVRTEEGQKIRKAFIAAPGCVLISADYSQIELRLLAHMAEISSLQEAFRNGEDIHARTASEIFHVPLEGMDPMVRRQAKAINFGIIYGQSAFGLAKQLKIERGAAAQYIELYFKRYPGIQSYMERTKELARKQGYVTTLFGRRCYVPTIHDKNSNLRSFAERAAINAPLQGTAADIIKKAMIMLADRFTERNLASRMILQVHDELLFEAPAEEADRVMPLIKSVMENVAQFSVPLTVEVNKGGSWAEIH